MGSPVVEDLTDPSGMGLVVAAGMMVAKTGAGPAAFRQGGDHDAKHH